MKNQLAEGNSVLSIRAIPIIAELTEPEFNQLIKKYNPPVEVISPSTSFQEAIKIKTEYPNISFRVSKQLKERWLRYIDSQIVGKYYPKKQSYFLVKILTDFLNKNFPEN